MNFFQMTSAPYFLAILISVMGWQLNTIFNEVISANAAAYGVTTDASQKSVTLRLQNLSQKKSLKDLRFSLVCREEGPCFGPADEAQRGSDLAYVIAHSPVAPTETRFVSRSAEAVTFETTLPAGSMVEIVARSASADSNFIFYYLPDSDHIVEIYLLREDSVFGYFLTNYINIIIISLAVAASLLGAWILIGVYLYFRKGNMEEKDENRVYRVILAREPLGGAPGGPAAGPGQDDRKNDFEI